MPARLRQFGKAKRAKAVGKREQSERSGGEEWDDGTRDK